MTDLFSDASLTATVIWSVLAIVCLLLELTSGGFYIMCFAVGCTISALSAWLGLGFVFQLLCFVVGSVISLFFVRPVMVRLMKSRDKEDVRTGVDAIIGRTAIVSEDIPAGGYGRVALDGDDWKACAEGGASFSKGETVTIVSQDSIILTVK